MKSHNLMLAALLGCALVSTQAVAATMQIEITGVNLTYSDPDGGGAGAGSLLDAGAPADSLTAMLVSDDNGPVGAVTSPPDSITLDLSVLDIPNIAVPGPNASTSVTAPAGGSLLLSLNSATTLALDLDTVEVVYSRISVGQFDIRVLFAGSVGSIASQDLPFGIEIADPVTVSFNLQGASTESGGFLTGFTGAGTGVLTAPMAVIPEPATVAVLGLAGIAGLLVRRRLA